MDALFDRFARIPILQKVLGLLGLCVVMSVAFYMLSYSPLVADFEAKSGEIRQLRQGLEEKKKMVADLAQYKRDVEKLNQDLQKALKLLPNRTEIPSLLQKISSLANKSGLEIMRFQPSPEVPQDFYARVPVALELKGAFNDVTSFFDAVGKLSRIVNIGSFAFGAVATLGEGGANAELRKKSLKVTCTATTFRFMANAADDSAEKPADAKKTDKAPEAAAGKAPTEPAAKPAEKK